MRTFRNNPLKAGKPLKASFVSWEDSRYCIRAVHTRFDDVEFIVTDAEKIDPETGLAEIVRQSGSVVYALRGMGAPSSVYKKFGL